MTVVSNLIIYYWISYANKLCICLQVATTSMIHNRVFCVDHICNTLLPFYACKNVNIIEFQAYIVVYNCWFIIFIFYFIIINAIRYFSYLQICESYRHGGSPLAQCPGVIRKSVDSFPEMCCFSHKNAHILETKDISKFRFLYLPYL